MHGRHRLPRDDLELDPRRRVVVVALGEADVLVGDRVSDAAHHALTMGGVGDPAGQVPQVAGTVPLGERHRLQALQQLGHRGRAVHDLPGWRLVAHADRVAAAQLDRVQPELRGQLVHLGLVAERRLHRAETAHRAARRVVRVDAVAVDVHVRHHVRADPHGPGVADHGRGAGGVRPAVQVDLGPDVDQPAVAGRAVLEAHARRVAVHVPVERLLPVVDHLHRLAGVQGQHARVHVHGQVLTPAERAADAGQHEPDLLRWQPQRRADLPLVDVQPLGGHVQVHPALAVRHREPRLGPEKGLVLHADPVTAGHDHVGRWSRVALADLEVADQVAFGHRVQPRGARVKRLPRVGHRRQDLVVHLDLLRRLPGDLGMVRGHERNRLALVADHALGQHRLVDELEPASVLAGNVRVREHGVHPAGGQRGADPDRADLRVRVRTAQRDAPDHAVHPQVAAVGELAGSFRRRVRPPGAGADTASGGRSGRSLGHSGGRAHAF